MENTTEKKGHAASTKTRNSSLSKQRSTHCVALESSDCGSQMAPVIFSDSRKKMLSDKGKRAPESTRELKYVTSYGA